MLGLTSIKYYLAAAAAAVLVAGCLFVLNLQNQVSALERDKAVLEQQTRLQEQAIAVQREAISQWEAARVELLERFGQLSQLTVEARGETRRLYDVFSKHDLGELAKRKPGLIERRINAGSARANRMLECASGNERSCRAIGKRAGEAAPAP